MNTCSQIVTFLTIQSACKYDQNIAFLLIITCFLRNRSLLGWQEVWHQLPGFSKHWQGIDPWVPATATAFLAHHLPVYPSSPDATRRRLLADGKEERQLTIFLLWFLAFSFAASFFTKRNKQILRPLVTTIFPQEASDNLKGRGPSSAFDRLFGCFFKELFDLNIIAFWINYFSFLRVDQFQFTSEILLSWNNLFCSLMGFWLLQWILLSCWRLMRCVCERIFAKPKKPR